MRWTLFRKILTALLLVSLLPILLTAIYVTRGLTTTSERLSEHLSDAINQQASESLEQQAQQVAADVARFLADCEDDLRLAETMSATPKALYQLYINRKETVWRLAEAATSPGNAKELLYRYTSLEVTDAKGNQTVAIRNGTLLPPSSLRNIAKPGLTEYGFEEYFAQTAKLSRGGVYVSHLNGFHLGKQEQLQGATDPELAIGGKEYHGVIRMAVPRFSKGGIFSGIVALGIDHRHLMEFTQHIFPGKGEPIVFPSYKSGNYAFMFDDEGWIITHPKYWDIRGVAPNGQPVAPYSQKSTQQDIELGKIPFNLDHAGFIHENYPVAAQTVRKGKSGAVDVTNVGGAKKVMAFAPIAYNRGDYGRYGVFGGITIGYQADQFQAPAKSGVALLRERFRQQLDGIYLIITASAILVILCALIVSQSITQPVAMLTKQASELARGESIRHVEVNTTDELRDLATTFNQMAEELEKRKQGLMETLEQLRSSERQITEEKNFKESVLDSISSGILTLSPSGRLTSINTTGQRILGEDAVSGADHLDLFRSWEGLAKRVANALEGDPDYGRKPLQRQEGRIIRHYDAGIFPIKDEAGGGITVTIRDETEKERFREEMIRLDRLASLGKLSAGIAHEVRNPLTGVSLLLDDLHDRMADHPEDADLIQRALQEIERVERLITSLLSYAAPPATCFISGDLNETVQDLLVLFRKSCSQQGIALQCDTSVLPPLLFDREKFRQALINLIKNAQEALPRGGTIDILTRQDDQQALISVRDNGTGIPEEDLPHLFEPFFTRKGAGTGLGLSITQRIIEEHGGSIDVVSLPGEGTTFTIKLPLAGA